jgi:hypothetical protein
MSMIEPTWGSDLGVLLCNAFNLDPNLVSSLVLTAEAGSLACLTVTRFLDRDDVERVSVVENFRLVPVDVVQSFRGDDQP